MIRINLVFDMKYTLETNKMASSSLPSVFLETMKLTFCFFKLSKWCCFVEVRCMIHRVLPQNTGIDLITYCFSFSNYPWRNLVKELLSEKNVFQDTVKLFMLDIMNLIPHQNVTPLYFELMCFVCYWICYYSKIAHFICFSLNSLHCDFPVNLLWTRSLVGPL